MLDINEQKKLCFTRWDCLDICRKFKFVNVEVESGMSIFGWGTKGLKNLNVAWPLVKRIESFIYIAHEMKTTNTSRMVCWKSLTVTQSILGSMELHP